MPNQPFATDPDNLPVAGVYVPGYGTASLQGGTPTTDSTNQVTSAPLAISDATSVSSSASLKQVSAAITNTSILAANANRKGASIYNNSSANLYLAFGATAATTAFSVKVPPNNLYEFPNPPVWTGAVSGIWDAANGNAQVTEVS